MAYFNFNISIYEKPIAVMSCDKQPFDYTTIVFFMYFKNLLMAQAFTVLLKTNANDINSRFIFKVFSVNEACEAAQAAYIKSDVRTYRSIESLRSLPRSTGKPSTK